MRIQLWSYNYDPEPLGIGPVSTIWAQAMTSRGHDVEVVAAHPHYPTPEWGTSLRPYREIREGIPVIRLPLVIGRGSRSRRLLQEVSFMVSQGLASPFLGGTDAIVSVSPSFPALLPALLASRARNTAWYLWLQDILPEGAATTGYLDRRNPIFRASRGLERRAYAGASGIVVLSDSFRENLLSKGVADRKISIAYNPATFEVANLYLTGAASGDPPRIICMGNIGRSQGLPEIVRNFEADPELARRGVRLTITGAGVAEGEVRSAIRTDRVEMTGLLSAAELQRELSRSSLAIVTQAYDEQEFNVPSKLMNYLAAGLPVVGSVRQSSEAARIIELSRSGWVTDPERFAASVGAALDDEEERRARSRNGFEWAGAHLTPESLADRFEAVMLGESRDRRPVGETV